MSRNVEDYRHDFLSKLSSSKVRDSVNSFPRDGKSVRQLAGDCSQLENNFGLANVGFRRTDGRSESKYDVMAVNDDSDNNNKGGRGGRGGRGGGRGGRGGGRGSSSTQGRDGRSSSRSREAKTGVFDILGTWGLPKTSCFHCFQDHAARDGPCSDTPCLFCGKKGHQSIRCNDAPKTQEAFKKATKNKTE